MEIVGYEVYEAGKKPIGFRRWVVHAAISAKTPYSTVSKIAEYSDLSVVDSNGRTLAHRIIGTDYAELLPAVLEKIDVDAADAQGFTPLMTALGKNDVASVSKLLESGANVDATDCRGISALTIALRCSIGQSLAAEIVSKSKNCNVHDINGATPLHYAVVKGYSAVVNDLLKKGASADAKDNDGTSVLKLALIGNTEPEIVTAVIAAAEDYASSDAAGSTSLDYAIKCGKLTAVKALVDKGVNVNAKGPEGRTPLMLAAAEGTNPDIIAFLLQKGADPKAEDDMGYIALDFANNNPFIFDTPAYKKLERASK